MGDRAASNGDCADIGDNRLLTEEGDDEEQLGEDGGDATAVVDALAEAMESLEAVTPSVEFDAVKTYSTGRSMLCNANLVYASLYTT